MRVFSFGVLWFSKGGFGLCAFFTGVQRLSETTQFLKKGVFAMRKDSVLITAHSDAEEMPQNSMEFLQYALQTAADVIEVDVHRDPHTGVLVLTHDWEEGGTYVSLESAFIMVSQHPSMRVNCDLKEAGLEPQVIGLAKKLGITERLIFSGTVDPEQVPLANREQIHWNIEEQIPDLYQRCQHDPAYVLQAAEKMCKRCIPPKIASIRISFSFSPGMEQQDAICMPQIEAALTRYYDCYPRDIQPMDAQQFLPIKNLITLSLEREGIYLGNAHRWAPEQEHIITTEQA